jgi:ABC-type transport system involved in cytochrome bd biosynthesis fused ATPase/permease subunit
VSNLINELILRLVKPLIAAVLGALVYWVATGVLGEPGRFSLALLCWLSAVGFILLVENNII